MVLLRLLAFKPAGSAVATAEKKTLKPALRPCLRRGGRCASGCTGGARRTVAAPAAPVAPQPRRNPRRSRLRQWPLPAPKPAPVRRPSRLRLPHRPSWTRHPGPTTTARRGRKTAETVPSARAAPCGHSGARRGRARPCGPAASPTAGSTVRAGTDCAQRRGRFLVRCRHAAGARRGGVGARARTGPAVATGGARHRPLGAARGARVAQPGQQPRTPGHRLADHRPPGPPGGGDRHRDRLTVAPPGAGGRAAAARGRSADHGRSVRANHDARLWRQNRAWHAQGHPAPEPLIHSSPRKDTACSTKDNSPAS